MVLLFSLVQSASLSKLRLASAADGICKLVENSLPLMPCCVSLGRGAMGEVTARCLKHHKRQPGCCSHLVCTLWLHIECRTTSYAAFQEELYLLFNNCNPPLPDTNGRASKWDSTICPADKFL